MKLLKQIFSKRRSKLVKKSVSARTDEKQKAILEVGSQQFKKLIERGIRVPVVLL